MKTLSPAMYRYSLKKHIARLEAKRPGSRMWNPEGRGSVLVQTELVRAKKELAELEASK